jgi:hypothetical protein
MPSWDEHYTYATQICTIEIERAVAREIDRFLDKPEVGRRGQYRLGHHDIHNEIGIELCRLIWGDLGAKYARAHIRLDRLPKFKRPNFQNINMPKKVRSNRSGPSSIWYLLFVSFLWLWSKMNDR